MTLPRNQIKQYADDGLLLLGELFSAVEVEALGAEVQRLAALDSPGTIFERDQRTLRALHGSHAISELCATLVRLPRLLEPARQILGSEVYVHQFKVNLKCAYSGDVWPWHQDFIFWHEQDGVREPRLLNVAVFLNEVNEFNGPLCFINGSHKHGTVQVPPAPDDGAASWQASFAADLKYSLDPRALAPMLQDGTLVTPKGPAGTVLLFHANAAHCSVPNLSPFDRTLILITYNSVENTPRPVRDPRPEFLVSRNFAPLVALPTDDLLGIANSRSGHLRAASL